MYSISNPFFANIRQSYEKSERFKETGIEWSMKERWEDAECGDDICLLARDFEIWKKS
jgi:hypothetical protein